MQLSVTSGAVLILPVVLLAVFAYVLYLVIRAGVRAGMRDHQQELTGQVRDGTDERTPGPPAQ